MGKGSKKDRNFHPKSLSTQLPSSPGVEGCIDDFHIKDKEKTGKLGPSHPRDFNKVSYMFSFIFINKSPFIAVE